MESKKIKINSSIDVNSNSYASLNYSEKSTRTQVEVLEEHIAYFEFDISQVKLNGEDLTLLNIKDVSALVKNQQKMSDMIYQDAIENNFAHEQMTPLNILKANSSYLAKRVFHTHVHINKELNKIERNWEKSQKADKIKYLKQIQERKKKNLLEGTENMKMILTMEQATRGLWYFNQSQIIKMKIKKAQNRQNIYECKDLQISVRNVLLPFELQISSRQIAVYFFQSKIIQKNSIFADWKQYELILFNVIQNAVKYNTYRGDIFVFLSCKPLRSQVKFDMQRGTDQRFMMLETQIIDTGIGVSKERQKLLFVPFLELKSLQGLLKKPENDNIGIGLNNSYSITKNLGGSIRIKQSEQGLTVFQFKIPVLMNENQEQFTESISSQIILLMGQDDRGFKDQTKEYLQQYLNEILSLDIQDQSKNIDQRIESAFQNPEVSEWAIIQQKNIAQKQMLKYLGKISQKHKVKRKKSQKQVNSSALILEVEKIGQQSLASYENYFNLGSSDIHLKTDQVSEKNDISLDFEEKNSETIYEIYDPASSNSQIIQYIQPSKKYTDQIIAQKNNLNQQIIHQTQRIQQKRKRSLKPKTSFGHTNNQIKNQFLQENSDLQSPSNSFLSSFNFQSNQRNQIKSSKKLSRSVSQLIDLNREKGCQTDFDQQVPQFERRQISDQSINQIQIKKNDEISFQKQNSAILNSFDLQKNKINSSLNSSQKQIIEVNQNLQNQENFQESEKNYEIELNQNIDNNLQYDQQLERVSDIEIQKKKQQLDALRYFSNAQHQEQLLCLKKLLFQSSFEKQGQIQEQFQIIKKQEEYDNLDQDFVKENFFLEKERIKMKKINKLIKNKKVSKFSDFKPKTKSLLVFKIAQGEFNLNQQERTDLQNEFSDKSPSDLSASLLDSDNSPIKRQPFPSIRINNQAMTPQIIKYKDSTIKVKKNENEIDLDINLSEDFSKQSFSSREEYKLTNKINNLRPIGENLNSNQINQRSSDNSREFNLTNGINQLLNQINILSPNQNPSQINILNQQKNIKTPQDADVIAQASEINSDQIQELKLSAFGVRKNSSQAQQQILAFKDFGSRKVVSINGNRIVLNSNSQSQQKIDIKTSKSSNSNQMMFNIKSLSDSKAEHNEQDDFILNESEGQGNSLKKSQGLISNISSLQMIQMPSNAQNLQSEYSYQ